MTNQFTNFESTLDRVDRLQNQRRQNSQKVIQLGIPFFDACFRGISAQDVVLLGAGSGVGKSEAASHISFFNAKRGKRVLHLALEAEENEVEMRQAYKVFASCFFADPFRERRHISYTDFYFGRLEDLVDNYQTQIRAEFESAKTLLTRYVRKDYQMRDFVLDVENADNVDLIVLDHLHFIDFSGTNENQEFKNALKTIREVVLTKNIPVLLVSQLRKDTGLGGQSAMPDIADFHGSSDIFKIATKGIMLASGKNVCKLNNDPATRRPTLMRAVKNRIDGSVKVYTGLMTYDTTRNAYEDDFHVGELVWKKDEITNLRVERFEPIPTADLPHWATLDPYKKE